MVSLASRPRQDPAMRPGPSHRSIPMRAIVAIAVLAPVPVAMICWLFG